ncbi:MAG: hypothetical protein ACRCXA_03725 [Peptostreptococcaceae bacterium]
MEEMIKKRMYTVVAIFELMLIVEFAAIMYFLYKVESIVLNPIPYTIGALLLMIVINYIGLSYIFKKSEEEGSSKEYLN